MIILVSETAKLKVFIAIIFTRTKFTDDGTGWPKSKFLISNGSTAEIDHIWDYVGKVKIGLRGGSFFLVSANFYIHFKYKGQKWQFSSSASMVLWLEC